MVQISKGIAVIAMCLGSWQAAVAVPPPPYVTKAVPVSPQIVAPLPIRIVPPPNQPVLQPQPPQALRPIVVPPVQQVPFGWKPWRPWE